MSHDDAFLQAILETPDDDTPRLIYADWLDEHGDPARAEFIRVQCRLAEIYFEDPSLPDLLAREHRLRSEFQDDWLDDLQSSLVRWTFHRGFLEEIVLSASTYRELYQVDGLHLSRPATVRRVGVDLSSFSIFPHPVYAADHHLAGLRRVSTLRRTRMRFYAETDSSVIRTVNCGVVFVMAWWSGPSRQVFGNLCERLGVLDPECKLELVVLDADGGRTDWSQIWKSMGGSGETAWVNDGQVVGTLQGLHPDGFDRYIRSLLRRCEDERRQELGAGAMLNDN